MHSIAQNDQKIEKRHWTYQNKYMLENTEEVIENGLYRETGYIGYTRWSQATKKHSTICVGHLTMHKQTQIT
jgi:hypothetical protein